MLSTLNDIKQGLVIKYDNSPWLVVEANFMRTSQRKPVMQTKLKNFITNKTLEISFKPGDKVEEADIDRTKAQFLYVDQKEANFMDEENYEQFTIERSVVEDKLTFLKEGQIVEVLKWQTKPVMIQVPKKVELKVTETPPGVKGDSAQGRVMKQATLENGATIGVPLFVKAGDIIRINTDTGEYVERANE